MLIAKVAIENVKYSFDCLYSYIIPDKYVENVSIGSIVSVPFGVQNFNRYGVVFAIESTDSTEIDIKSLKKIFILYDKCFFTESQLDLIKWMKSIYFCTYFDVIKLITPLNLDEFYKMEFRFDKNKFESVKNLISYDELSLCQNILKSNLGRFNVKDLKKISGLDSIYKYVYHLLDLEILCINKILLQNYEDKTYKALEVISNSPIISESLTDRQKKVYEFVLNNHNTTVKEVCYYTGVSKSIIYNMVKKGIFRYNSVVRRIDDSIIKDNDYINKDVILTDIQLDIYNKIIEKFKLFSYNVSLLHGITGSGKSMIFLKIIDYAISLGKDVIFMVPEISLTEQFISLFKSRYGDLVAVIHSGLTKKNRIGQWNKIRSGKCKIVIGTRSAIFSPVKNLGLVIIDEEHDASYKSEATPRFNAKDVAKYICHQNSSMLILSSATPSIESYFKAKNGVYNLYTLNKRYGLSTLPKVEIVDMNSEIDKGNSSLFSRQLITEIKQSILNNRQSILLLNRRGYNNFIKCRVCNEVIMCPNCNISLNYHIANHRLMCHYCGYSDDFIDKCPKCASNKIIYMGYGTQKVEDELKNIIPNVRILRMDSDSITSKNSYKENFDNFSKGKYDVMIGTQMISKGFNFPNVTLVGVISADQSLYGSDFRSYEKTFSLITQVIGRAGRGEHPGKALIQTFTPENSVINMAGSQDYVAFYDSEIAIRKAMLYPPFSDICVVGFSSKDEQITYKASVFMFKIIKNIAHTDYKNIPLRIFYPTIANLSKISNKYRCKIILKCKNDKNFREMISKALIDFRQYRQWNSVNLFIDINPNSIF